MNGPREALDVALQIAVTGTDVPTGTDCEAWVRAALLAGGRPPVGNITVRLVDAEESARLNATYRNRPGPTNVLAFPGPGEMLSAPDAAEELGDLVVCWPVACREAAAQGKSAQHHFAHLVVHGTFHLIGYDHERPDEAGRMEALEIQALQSLGIADPYN
jgi:probable rRNA maturation factor